MSTDELFDVEDLMLEEALEKKRMKNDQEE